MNPNSNAAPSSQISGALAGFIACGITGSLVGFVGGFLTAFAIWHHH
jgi:hypothetical protein